MSPYRAALLALVVVGAAFASAAPAGATSGVDVARDALSGTQDALDGTAVQVDAPVDAEERANVDNAQDSANDTNNSALGADISSFMQSSVAETDGAVETGMWSAAFNGTENRSVRKRLVERRTGQLRAELAELREEKEELIAEREAGNVSETAYKARVSRLAGQINAMESSIDATSSKARNVGADVEELTNLRTETKDLSGPEVSAVARNVSGVGVGNGDQGPPDDVGNGNGLGNAGNGTVSVPDDAGNGTASLPNDAGQGNDTTDPGQRGPPSDRGNAPLANNVTGNETPGEGGDETPGEGVGNGTPGQRAANGAPSHNGTPGHDGLPGRGPKAITSPTPTGVLDGSNVQSAASASDAPVVSTVRLPATDFLAASFSP